jgi:hypothetical protein
MARKRLHDSAYMTPNGGAILQFSRDRTAIDPT